MQLQRKPPPNSRSADVAKRNCSSRLVEIDVLRGIAALAVVLFHYTTQFTALFGSQSSPTFSFPYGHYGVNLFFIISGFVIFMTLERTSRPMDFVVSRFSRLFPSYWVAIFLTFSITHVLGLPDKLVGIAPALGNLIMIHGIFHIPHVDDVYWTLEVELLFYMGMFLLYRFRVLHLIHYALLSLLALRLIYFVLASRYGIDLPWTISRLLILKYIPWFSLGISIYLATKKAGTEEWHRPTIIAGFAILNLLIVDSLFLSVLAATLATAVLLAASGRAPWLRQRILVWFGTISYPLYLLHENIGWSLQLRLGALGIPIDLAILIALATCLALSTAVTLCVEQPAMRWIRSSYRNRLAIAQ